MSDKPTVHVIGGGLAGSEACWQALRAGNNVVLHEMRPKKMTEAHRTGNLAELVCSNSLKSLDEASAPGQLKWEMSELGSLIVAAAHEARVPAGHALAIDRAVFSKTIESKLNTFEDFTRVDEEVTSIPSEEELKKRNEVYVVATGPLTSSDLAESLKEIAGIEDSLYFYDAIAPTVSAESLDMDHCFFASRYDKGDKDYINISLNKEEYETLIGEIKKAEKVTPREFEEPKYFESCLPIEVMIDRGDDTLRFGPMKPVGITNPKTGRWAYANIQLRQENKEGSMYSMVGFQTRLKWPEQKRIFSMLPAFKNIEFLRMGTIHRNTYFESPKVLSKDLSFKNNGRVFLAGQVSGVEGYTESAAMGLLAGRSAAAVAKDEKFEMPPRATILGALHGHVTASDSKKFDPMNANLGLLPTIPKTRGVSKADRKAEQCRRAREVFSNYRKESDIS